MSAALRLTAAAALAVGGLLILGAFDAFSPVAAAAGALRAHLAVAALGCALALAAQGARGGALALALAALIAAASLGPTRALQTEAAVAGRHITLVTANLLRTNTAQDQAARDLLALDADILALQEIPPGFLETQAALRRAYPYGRVHVSPVPPNGQAVLSRLPLAKGGAPPRAGHQPGHAALTLDLGGGATLRVMSVHFGWPAIGGQELQIARFDRFATDFAPIHGASAALVGDFNATRWSAAVARAGAVAGAAPVGPLRGTYRAMSPERLPRFLSALPFGLPIDHILLSRDVALRRLEAVPIAGSDHMALRAELIVPPREDRP